MIKSMLALVFIIILISGISYLIKPLSKLLLQKNLQNNSISKLENFYLDHKRKVTLIKCDNKKYLIVTGGGSDCIIEHRENDTSEEGY